jgi:hypothetical protein
MSDGSTTNSPSGSSPGQSRPSLSPASPACWAAHVTSAIVALAVAVPLGRALPPLITLAAERHEWKPLAFALLSLGMCVAPVPTLALLGRLIPGRSNTTKE